MKKLLFIAIACLLLCGCTQTDDAIASDTVGDTFGGTETTAAPDTEANTDAPDGAPVIYFAENVTDTAVRLYSGHNLPPLPEPVERYELSYEDGKFHVGDGVLYTDNGAVTFPGTGVVRFEFSIYQDSMPYTDPIVSLLGQCVTVDYEFKHYDRLDFAKEHIKITVNGEASELTEVSLGKGNGHVDYYITASVDEGFNLAEMEKFEITIE